MPETSNKIAPAHHAVETARMPVASAPAAAGTEAPEKADFLLDRIANAVLARATLGISPASLAMAYSDWGMHLATAPGKQLDLVRKAARKLGRLNKHISQCAFSSGAAQGDAGACIEPLAQDRRFRDPAWQQPPYCYIYQAFLLQQQWWHNATTGVPGVSKHHEEVVEFATRQFLDIFSPSNYLPSNPVLLQRTLAERGMNLLRGWQNFIEDAQRLVAGQPPVGAEAFKVGEQVAVTPGKVVYRNRLIELIQYAPATEKVRAEPVLILPAWIMKYYILDLSQQNSLVRYLVDQGHSVFMVSWKNPDYQDRDLGMEEYVRLGAMAAIDAVSAIMPERKIHAAGYCLGGTLLAITAAAMARREDDRLASMTMLAAQVDFKEAGELTLFIDESQVRFLEDMMWEQGYLETKQMAGAFQLLRSNDLIWSRLLSEYLIGERSGMNDLMAWNADQTRMPYRMHSEYLRRLFLDNDLAEGRYRHDGRLVSLSDIRVPIFAVGTERDHVAPWRSVFKIDRLTHTDVTLLLTSGGHNAGIVSDLGRRDRHYRIDRRQADNQEIDIDAWMERHVPQAGSWWPAWQEWLARLSGPAKLPAPRKLGSAEAGYEPLMDAPGSYVMGQ
ncbi:MAG: polyhydroxyalkanoic acid synthase [Ferrovibrio sp.]|nr:polyhydroxyalkanoic acid synthase [Ferrovibrio sp.]